MGGGRRLALKWQLKNKMFQSVKTGNVPRMEEVVMEVMKLAGTQWSRMKGWACRQQQLNDIFADASRL